MNLFYWSPFLSKVATVKAVLNSAISVRKYSKKLMHPYIINSVGEWNEFNLDLGLTSMDDFQTSNDASAQRGTLSTSGGLFVRPSFNYYITSFFGVRASYFQMIGSDTTVKAMITVGAVFKL